MNKKIIVLAFMTLLLFGTVFAVDFAQLEKAAVRQKIKLIWQSSN